VVNFSIATDEYFRGEDGMKVHETDWHQCVAWDSTAEALTEHVHKGQKLAVIGRLMTEKYERDGQQRYATRVHVRRYEICGSFNPGSQWQNDDETQEEESED